ncbi:MAG: LysM peptidoglycan-binding domain-containing protein [Porphyromonas sp.]|nr:LysM peptidoglycan-binding domain-containing protein [Porphyromonas sp.]
MIRLRFLLLISLFLLLIPGTKVMAMPLDSLEIVSVEADLGLLPENLDEKLDSLISQKYIDYYKIGKPGAVPKGQTYPSYLPDSVYIKRLAALPSRIPLSYNSVVRECIELYVNRRRALVSTMLPKTRLYFPMIEEVFDKHGLPHELKYLAIVESNLNPIVVSRMGATGLWQFMLNTGKIYGLDINSLIDERRDPRLATEAAARYFKDMYDIYQDWLIVIASYNCGPGNINKAIRRAGGERKFWSIFPYLPRETRAYVPLFIAAYYTMEYYKIHGIEPREMDMVLATDTIHIRTKRTFEEISRLSGQPIDVIKSLNPKYKHDIVPGSYNTQIVTLPTQAAMVFSFKRDSLNALSSFAGQSELPKEIEYKEIYHTVRKRETLASISRKYEVQVDELKEWNPGVSSSPRSGTQILIRLPKDTETQSFNVSGIETTEPQTNKGKQSRATTGSAKRYYIVKKGDTLGAIAAKYKGVTVTSLKRANGLKSNNIKIGQRLIIP